MENVVYVLANDEPDFFAIICIYNNYLKAYEDYHNLKKYNQYYSDLHIYEFEINKLFLDFGKYKQII